MFNSRKYQSYRVYGFVLLVLLSIGRMGGYAQALNKIAPVSVPVETFDTDFLGNVYIVSGSALVCYAPDGTKKYSYEKKGFGKLTDIDCSNMHKTVLFFAEPGMFIFLDKNGAEIGAGLSIRDLGLYAVQSFCHASDGTLWLCDSDRQVLVQISRAGRILFTSTNWGRFANGSKNSKLFLSEDMLVLSSDNALHIFSQQGAYIKTVHLPDNITFVNVWKNRAFCRLDRGIVAIDLHTNAEVAYQNQPKEAVIFCTNKLIFSLGQSALYFESVRK